MFSLAPIRHHLAPLDLPPDVYDAVVAEIKGERSPMLRPASAIAAAVVSTGAVVGALSAFGRAHTVVILLAFLIAQLVVILARNAATLTLVIEVLRRHDIDVCGRCAFDLRGLPATTLRCPECGYVRERIPPTPNPTSPSPHATTTTPPAAPTSENTN